MIDMINPPLDVVMSKVDCKYTLVVFAAKRARDILETGGEEANSHLHKPVTFALAEIAEGRISYERTKSGIK